MKLFNKPNITIAVLFIYTTCMYIYFFPRNHEMSNTEKWAIVVVSYIVLGILWFLMRRRSRMRQRYEDEKFGRYKNSNENKDIK